MLRWLWPSVPKRVCIWTSFLTGFPHYAQTEAWSANSESDWSRVYAYFGVTCHLHFCQNNWGLLCATAVPLGWNGHRIRVCTQSRLWKRKFSRRSCRDSNWQPFDHESGAQISKLSVSYGSLTGSLNCQIEAAVERMECLVCACWLADRGMSVRTRRYINDLNVLGLACFQSCVCDGSVSYLKLADVCSLNDSFACHEKKWK